MYNYVIVPVICLACYCFLLLSFAASKKNILIKSYMSVLISLILWTGGSFLMRVQFPPSIKFWYDISILGLLSCVFSFFTFVTVYTKRKVDGACYFWCGVSLIAALINATTGWFLEAPSLVETSTGVIKFVYEENFHAYIFYSIGVLCAIHLTMRVLKELKQNPDLFKELYILFIGAFVMLVGQVLLFIPFFKGFPIDMLSGIVMALCMYLIIYQKRIFKLTLLVSRINLQFASFLVTSFIFAYAMAPIERFIATYLSNYGEFKILLVAAAFSLTVFLVFLFFKSFTDRVFTKNEIKQTEVINRFSVDVSKTLNIDEVINLTIEEIKSVLPVNDIVIGLLDEEKHEYKITGEKRYFVYPTISANSQIFRFLNTVDGCTTYTDFLRSVYYRSTWQKDKDYLRDLGVELMIPLKQEQLIGCILLPKKLKGNYSYDEMVFLSSIASVASIAIKNSNLYNKVYLEAIQDDLTSVYNRKYFLELLNDAYEKMQTSLTLMNVSIDDFRLYNQLYGTAKGDEALCEVANILKTCVDKSGYVARIQGKDFSVVLPEYDILRASKLATEIRKQVININKADIINAKVLTVSIGIASIPTNATNVKQLIEYADHSLYIAKKEGKNCVNIYNLDTLKSDQNVGARPNTSAYTEYSSTIYALLATIDSRDHYTFKHSKNVAYYATELAKHYGLNDDLVETVREAALLHDIGKISIPENILNKQGKLTDEEYEIVKGHVDNSIGIIKHLPSLDYVIPAVVSHHERWDGKGYPRHIAGNDIPLAGRILCVADCFDAITSKRCYKEAWAVEDTCQEILRNANKQFDPKLAELFVNLVRRGDIKIQYHENEND